MDILSLVSIFCYFSLPDFSFSPLILQILEAEKGRKEEREKQY